MTHPFNKACSISLSVKLSNTELFADFIPNALAAHPKCNSSTCPKFILDGTPIGLRMISTGVPSSKYGISSCGNIFATTPLFPCLPAILSPSEIFLV